MKTFISIILGLLMLSLYCGYQLGSRTKDEPGLVQISCLNQQGQVVWQGAVPLDLEHFITFPKALQCIRHEHIERFPTPIPSPTQTFMPLPTP